MVNESGLEIVDAEKLGVEYEGTLDYIFDLSWLDTNYQGPRSPNHFFN